MPLPSLQIGRPQLVAAVLLSAFVLQCLWLISKEPINETDYRFARCGREMWEHHPPLLGYFTSCGNIHDGVLAYRVAAAPLSVAIALDDERRGASVWEFGRSLAWTKYAIRLPFVVFGVWLGGALWWVSRRLFGNEGGYVALGLYCFSPHIIGASARPSPEILAAWGLFGFVFTAIGVAHTLYAPADRWRKRILLLGIAVGVTAGSHLAAAWLGLLFAVVFMLYLAPQRRVASLLILASSCGLASIFLFGAYSFSLENTRFLFQASTAALSLTVHPFWQFVGDTANLGVLAFLAVGLSCVVFWRRCRYFGNTAPLLVAALLIFLRGPSAGEPSIWALPFLFVFVAGTFADLLDSRQHTPFAIAGLLLLVTNALLCIMALPAMAFGSVWTL